MTARFAPTVGRLGRQLSAMARGLPLATPSTCTQADLVLSICLVYRLWGAYSSHSSAVERGRDPEHRVLLHTGHLRAYLCTQSVTANSLLQPENPVLQAGCATSNMILCVSHDAWNCTCCGTGRCQCQMAGAPRLQAVKGLCMTPPSLGYSHASETS